VQDLWRLEVITMVYGSGIYYGIISFFAMLSMAAFFAFTTIVLVGLSYFFVKELIIKTKKMEAEQ